MNKEQYKQFTKEVTSLLSKVGATKRDEPLLTGYGESWEMKTRSNVCTINLEVYDPSSKVFSIFSRFEECPEYWMNSKKNFHRTSGLVTLHEVKGYINQLSNI